MKNLTVKWLFCAWVCIPATPLRAQSDQVLTARSAKNTVFLDINEEGKDLRFLSNRTDVDDLQWEYATKEEEKVLLLIKDNTYNLRLRLTNPLKYRITVEGNKYEDDEYEKVVRGLADNFQVLLNVLTRSTGNFGSLGAGDDLRSAPLFDPGKSITATGQVIELGGVSDVKGFGATRDKLNGLADLGLRLAITTMHRVKAASWDDEESIQTIRSEAVQSIFIEDAKRIEANTNVDMLNEAAVLVQQLMNIDLSAHGANKTLSHLKEVIQKMSKQNQALDTLLRTFTLRPDATPEAMARVLKSHSEMLRKAEKQDSTEYFKLHMAVYMETHRSERDWLKRRNDAIKAVGADWGTRRQRRWSQPIDDVVSDEADADLEMLSVAGQDFVERMRGYLGAREKLVQNLNELMRLVSNAAQISSKTEHGTDLIWSNTIPKGKTEIVTVKVQHRTLSMEKNFGVKVKEEDLFSRDIKLMRVHTFYPQAFPAVVFVNDVFQEFSAKEDSVGLLRVRAKENSQGYFNIAGMLNFNMKMGRATEVPFIQVGLSTKKAQPQVFLGGGIRFTEWLGVSIGAALTWQADLDKLAIGDKVDNQDAIDGDLKYRMSDPKFYFGIQLRPSTITKKP